MKPQGFIDWMKALGMLLIVIGHVVGDPRSLFNASTQPAYAKQLGVTLFVFVTGWSLANETRPGLRVVFNRLFPLYFLGLLCASIVSGVQYAANGDLQESNYPPFVLGLNVALNYFPANPTTWYIGTYLHLLLLWLLLLRGREIRPVHLLAAFVLENAGRVLMLSLDQDFIAYMLLPNWLTSLLLGMHLRRRADLPWSRGNLMPLCAWAAFLYAWSKIGAVLPFDSTIPIRDLPGEWSLSQVWRSLALSAVYAANTWACFQVARRLPAPRVVTFFARNTVIIFLAHMPALYLLAPFYRDAPGAAWIKRLALILLLYAGLAVVSEGIQRVIRVQAAREWAWARLCRLAPGARTAWSRGVVP